MDEPLIPHCGPPVWGSIRTDRFAATIATSSPEGCSVALLGLPDDLGVRLNRGRPGAAEGPRAFREALSRYGTHFDLSTRSPMRTRVFDAGDVTPADGDDEKALHETHRRVTEASATLHALGMTVVCVGGGHDLTFPAVRPLSVKEGKAIGGVNIDPHLDVRSNACSGMPFRSLIEGGHLDAARFAEVGIGRFVNSEEHAAYLLERGAQIHTIDDYLLGRVDFEALLQDVIPEGEAGFVSLDLDVLDASQAPGVSALNPMGIGVADAARMVEIAARHPGVRHFDIMELSPPNDHEGRTARIAAFLFLTFVAAFPDRPS